MRQDKIAEMTLEKDTIKFTRALDEKLIPKLKGLEYTEETLKQDGTIERRNPRKATLQEKMKLSHVIAERQARLQRQINWLHAEQEKHRKNQTQT